MKKKSFTKCCRLVCGSVTSRKFEKKVRNKARRRVKYGEEKAFEKTTGAWNIA